MTRAEIAAFFPFPVVPFFYDDTYGAPTHSWLFTSFYPWFRETLRREGNEGWTRKHDCDNFARRFAVHAQEAHAETGDRNEGLAVGEFCYISPRGPHAIVCAITDKGLTFIEPQTGGELTLTQQELQSCFRVSF